MTSEMPTYNQDYAYLNFISLRSADSLRYIYDQFIAYKNVFLPLGLRRGQKLLDVGSCTGRFGQYFSNFGIKTTGIELNLAAIYQGGIDFPNNPTHSVNGNAAHLPFDDGCFDRVMSYDFLEHLPQVYLSQVLSEMSRVLSTPIMFHKITPTEDVQNINNDTTHVTKWNTHQWIAFFNEQGWQVIGPTIRYTPKLKPVYGHFLIVKS